MMKMKDRLARCFATMSLIVVIWLWIAAIYYFSEMLSYSLASIGMYLWGIGLVMSGVVLWKYKQKWHEIWYVLKPSVLRLLIFAWHVFAYFVTKNIMYNILITVFFTFYTLRRCKVMNLRGLDIGDELDRILKMNNNAFYMTSIFFLWYYVRLSDLVDIVMAWIGMDYAVSLLAIICLFIVAMYGFVRFQYVLCMNIAHVKLNFTK